jgi:copper chaperone
MIEFKVPDMTCGHCVQHVTQAIQSVDARAKVQIDLPSHTVVIESDTPREPLAAALAEAGYPAE